MGADLFMTKMMKSFMVKIVQHFKQKSRYYHSYTESLREHPLLHNSILESDDIDSRKKLYKGFRARKDPYWEELIAKGMHPCRVIQWCMTEEEKEGFSQIPPYIFLEGRADWDLEF